MEVNESIDELRGRLKELKDLISKLRKEGFDMTIPTLRITNIPTRINIAEITLDREDFQKAKELLEETMKEIVLVKEQSLKKEKAMDMPNVGMQLRKQ